jgi:hypothetical protein
MIPTSLKRGTKSQTISNVTPAIRSASSRLYGPRHARAGCNPVNQDFLSFCERGSLTDYERIKRSPLTLSFDIDRYSRFAACSFDRRKQHRWLDLRGGAPLQLKNSSAPPHLFRALQPPVHLRYQVFSTSLRRIGMLASSVSFHIGKRLVNAAALP